MAKRKRTSIKKQLTDDNTDALEQAAKKAAERAAGATGQQTKKPAGKTFNLDDTQPVKQTKRQTGITAKGRAKFTTMLRTDLREKLDNTAKRNHMSIADVLEQVITEYFGIK